MLEEILAAFSTVSPASVLLAAIGGVVFAVFFNIPARRKLLSRESDTRKKAMRYDALNFTVFFATFILAQGILRVATEGGWPALASLVTWFVVYSVAFWAVLSCYIYWKDSQND